MQSSLPRLRELRELKQETQKQLGDALGFTARSIIRWEKGDSDPVLTDLRRIAAYFDVSVGYLIGESDQLCRPSTDRVRGLDANCHEVCGERETLRT